MKITGTLASTAHGLYDEPRIARHNAYDARYVSFHAVDLHPPIPSYSAVYDGELWAQHGPGARIDCDMASHVGQRLVIG